MGGCHFFLVGGGLHLLEIFMGRVPFSFYWVGVGLTNFYKLTGGWVMTEFKLMGGGV